MLDKLFELNNILKDAIVVMIRLKCNRCFTPLKI